MAVTKREFDPATMKFGMVLPSGTSEPVSSELTEPRVQVGVVR
jgi:hypothetical protein